MEFKTCSKCGLILPTSRFYVIKNGKLHSWCKSCLLAARRNYYNINKERSKSTNKAWSVKNRDRINKEASERRASNPDRYRAYSQKYYNDHRERILEKQRHRPKELRALENAGYRAKIKDDLSDVYIRGLLAAGLMSTKIIPETLVEAKRELVRLKRLLNDIERA